MIRSLRLGHRGLATLLLIGGPVAVAIALGGRRSPPISELPVAPTAIPVTIPGLSIEVVIGGDSTGATSIAARRSTALRVADPLLYAAATGSTDTLPSGAILLGPIGAGFDPGTLVSSDSLVSRPFLIVWSNGTRRAVASAPFDLIGRRPR